MRACNQSQGSRFEGTPRLIQSQLIAAERVQDGRVHQRERAVFPGAAAAGRPLEFDHHQPVARIRIQQAARHQHRALRTRSRPVTTQVEPVDECDSLQFIKRYNQFNLNYGQLCENGSVLAKNIKK